MRMIKLNTLIKIWAVIALLIAGIAVWAWFTDKVSVGPKVPVTTLSTPLETHRKLDSLQAIATSNQAKQEEINKRLIELKKSYEQTNQKRAAIQRQVDSIAVIDGDANKLLRSLANTAQTRWD